MDNYYYTHTIGHTMIIQYNIIQYIISHVQIITYYNEIKSTLNIIFQNVAMLNYN